MKNFKFVVLCAICLFSLNANAQFVNSSKKSSSDHSTSEVTVKYQGEITFGAFIGNSSSLSIGTTQGVMITDYFFAGLSVYGDVSTDDFGWWNVSPLISLKGYYPFNEKLRIFLNPELGASIGVAGSSDTPWFYIENSGSTAFEYRVTAGVEVNKFIIGLGCGGGEGASAFYAKVGIRF